MKFEFIKTNLDRFALKPMLKVLGVSKSGYYAARNWAKSNRAVENERIEVAIEEVFIASRSTYGSPRVTKSLAARGVKASRNRVVRLMRAKGLQGKTRREFRAVKGEAGIKVFAGNRLKREFHAEKPNLKWVSDFTFIPTTESWLFLSVVLDLFSRKVIGWAMSDQATESLTIKALQMARDSRRPCAGLLHHSDRGAQYTSGAYTARLESMKVVSSMSSTGDCWDNAVVEAFFATLKLELSLERSIGSRAVTESVIFEWIEVWYNRKQLHSTLGCKSPMEFEENWSREQMLNLVSTKP